MLYVNYISIKLEGGKKKDAVLGPGDTAVNKKKVSFLVEIAF